jgi:hypothetical protein|tara:strand:+ start:810 stop:1349 length:540 start_codon:yes stop_codon:yes gene_type:complete
MALTLISTHTASADSSIDITSGITDTYDSYEFHFVNMHPATDNVSLTFQVNATDGADYNDSAITSTYIAAYHKEDGAGGYLIYEASYDQTQGTAYQMLMDNLGNVSDESASGVLTLYAPSSTTYVKNFTSTLQAVTQNQYSRNTYVAGYINDTTAIDNISFKMSSGNIDAGTIKMFGVS